MRQTIKRLTRCLNGKIAAGHRFAIIANYSFPFSKALYNKKENHMKMKGKMIRWNEDRGFGFLKSTKTKGDIFIHISSLKTMSRRPQIDDVIFFDLVTEDNGKNKAINASIEGVAVKTVKRRKTATTSKSNNTSNLTILIVILALIFVVYKTYSKWSPTIVESLPVSFVEEDFSGLQCEGKQYCNQMTSCKEARFYLKNCPDVKIDGNNDGVPCESQWCN